MKALEDVLAEVKEAAPSSYIDFTTDGDDKLEMELPTGWNTGLKEKADEEMTEAVLTVHGQSYELTKSAALDLTSSMGVTRDYVCKTPASLMQPHINHWLKNQGKAHRLLLDGGVGAVLSKQGNIFEATALIERAADALGDVLGEDPMVMDVMEAGFNRVSVRLVGAGGLGIQLNVSPSGATPLTLSPVVTLADGAIILPHPGTVKFRSSSGDQVDAEDWVVEHATEILTDASKVDYTQEFKALGDHEVVDPSGLIADVFTAFKIPLPVREVMLEEILGVEDLTGLSVIEAVAKAAVDPDLADIHREAAMRAGGGLMHQIGAQCVKCHRLPIH